MLVRTIGLSVGNLVGIFAYGQSVGDGISNLQVAAAAYRLSTDASNVTWPARLYVVVDPSVVELQLQALVQANSQSGTLESCEYPHARSESRCQKPDRSTFQIAIKSPNRAIGEDSMAENDADDFSASNNTSLVMLKMGVAMLLMENRKNECSQMALWWWKKMVGERERLVAVGWEGK